MGIMGGKNTIVNTEVKGREFFRMKSVIRRYFGIDGVTKILYVVDGKSVYEAIVDENKSYRLDIYTRNMNSLKKRTTYQKIAYENGVNVPKVLGIQPAPEGIYKLSDWIKGMRIGLVWNMPHMFKQAGIEVAKINIIKDPESSQYLGYNDFSKANAIWTPNQELYLIDIEIQPKENVDGNVVKLLLKNLKDRERIKWFLRGYKRVRSSYDIEKILEEKQYKW